MPFASESTQGFYFDGDALPDDAVQISDALYQRVIISQTGSPWRLVDGDIVFEQPAQIDAAAMLNLAKIELRPLRDKILQKVVDIGTAAMATGNTALKEEVFLQPNGVRQRLLDITDDPSLNAATTREDMEASVIAYYAAIVSTVSPELRGAFKDLEK